MSKNPNPNPPAPGVEVIIGTVLPKGQIFLSFEVGSAKAGNGEEFDILTDSNHQPMIQSKSTGKTWVVTWGELISLAVVAGITEA